VADLMTLEEVANYLRVNEKTIYRMLDKRGIPALKVGHQWRFDKASTIAGCGRVLRRKKSISSYRR